MSKQYKACVLGAGAFGTAMANTASLNSYMSRVSIYARDQAVVDGINNHHRNPKVFADYLLSEQISATSDLAEALQDSTYILSCLPCQQLRTFLEQNKELFEKNIPFVSCSKGINLKSGQLVSEVVKEVLGEETNYAVLSGPTFAAELMKKFPSCIVVASENENTSKLIQLGLSSEFFRIFSQKDVAGVELAGALKNIIAIGAGIIEGAGYGLNSSTAFLARGMREMQTFAHQYGASRHTFYGLAGIGDLMLTSFGKLSRNRQFGQRIGEGESLQDIIKSSDGVVEGVPTLELVHRKSIELNLDMPLINVIYSLVHAKISHQEALKLMMLQKLEEEFPPTFEDLVNE